MSIDLAVTLGHNSSCVAINSYGEILCGFEEERLTGVKSDSSYPILSIEKCLTITARQKVRDVHISHWFADGELKKCKYYDIDHMNSIGADKIISVSKDFTHHDAHNYSAIAFAQSEPGFEEDFFSLVVDGFGTQGECVSIYTSTAPTAHFTRTKLLHRAFGYNKSLGILYQYATAFLGMKMQQDEYKLLGYEAHCETLHPEDFEIIGRHAERLTKRFFEGIMNPMAIDRDKDPIVNINALKATKDQVFKDLWELLDEFDIDDRTTFEAKVIVAMLVQQVVENIVLALVTTYGIKKLICSGGVFMNVKLNMKLSQVVEKLCVMPLAGDQGAALGLYHYHKRNLVWPDHLYWGTRDWSDIDKINSVEDMMAFTDLDDFQEAVIQELDKVGYVNVVMGEMEYGPRALCNTTTLAIPTRQCTEEINELNDRTTIMPMAPVMTAQMADEYLHESYKVYHKSLKYMIGACVLKPEAPNIDGAAHSYTSKWFGPEFKTCRPQIVEPSHPVHGILQIMNHPLINTSFNYHGVPIVYNVADIIKSHKAQNENGQIKTFILYGQF